MGLFLKNRWILLAALALTLLVSAAVILPGTDGEAQSFTRCGTEIHYYSDPELTVLVGVYGWLPTHCGCQSYSWGTISPYRTYEDSFC